MTSKADALWVCLYYFSWPQIKTCGCEFSHITTLQTASYLFVCLSLTCLLARANSGWSRISLLCAHLCLSLPEPSGFRKKWSRVCPYLCLRFRICQCSNSETSDCLLPPDEISATKNISTVLQLWDIKMPLFSLVSVFLDNNIRPLLSLNTKAAVQFLPSLFPSTHQFSSFFDLCGVLGLTASRSSLAKEMVSLMYYMLDSIVICKLHLCLKWQFWQLKRPDIRYKFNSIVLPLNCTVRYWHESLC